MKNLLVGLVLLTSSTFLFSATNNDPKAEQRSPRPDAQGPSLWSLQLTTAMDFPLGESGSVFQTGAQLAAGAEYRLPSLRFIYLCGVVGYANDVGIGVPLSVSVLSFALGGGLRYDLLRWFSVKLGVSGGGFGCLLSNTSAFGTGGFISADAGLVLLPSPWHLTLGASYHYFLNFYSGVSASLGLSYELPAPAP